MQLARSRTFAGGFIKENIDLVPKALLLIFSIFGSQFPFLGCRVGFFWLLAFIEHFYPQKGFSAPGFWFLLLSFQSLLHSAMNMLRRMVRTTNVHQGPELDTIEEGGNVDAQSDSPADSQPPPAELVNAAGDTHGTEELQVAAGSPAPGFPATDEQQLTTRLLREQKAESFMACVKNKFKPTRLLMTEQEILNCCINPTAAPEAFREAYDTQKRFDWATSGFSPVLASFFPGGQKTPESARQICASMTLYDPSVVQRAKEVLARFPNRDRVPTSFFVASCFKFD